MVKRGRYPFEHLTLCSFAWHDPFRKSSVFVFMLSKLAEFELVRTTDGQTSNIFNFRLTEGPSSAEPVFCPIAQSATFPMNKERREPLASSSLLHRRRRLIADLGESNALSRSVPFGAISAAPPPPPRLQYRDRNLLPS